MHTPANKPNTRLASLTLKEHRAFKAAEGLCVRLDTLFWSLTAITHPHAKRKTRTQ